MFEKKVLRISGIRKFNVTNLIIIPLCVLMLNTYTIFMKYSVIFRLLYLIGILVYMICHRWGIGIQHRGQKIWCIFLGYLVLTLPFSMDVSSTMDSVISIFICSSILILMLKQEFFTRLIRVWNVFNFICVLTMFVNLFIPSLMTGILDVFVIDVAKETLSREIAAGVYSGIFSEKNAAAYGACIGFVFAYSRYIRLPKIRYILLSLYYVVAIFLSGKRMAMFVPVIFCLLILFVNRKKLLAFRRIRRYLIAMCIAIIVAFFSMPQVRQSGTKIVNLFIEQSSTDVTNNRATLLWPVALQMFGENYLIGAGLNTYNSYIQSISTNASPPLSSWRYNAHNIYLQLLGELGVLGAGIIFALFIYNILHSLKLYKSTDDLDKKQLCFISLGLQSVFLLVGITENTFYTTGQLLTYFVAMGINQAIDTQKWRVLDNE